MSCFSRSRFANLLVILGSISLPGVGLLGICAGQDTNFSAGPQYLVNGRSSLFLHPIETPSLSLSAPPATTGTAPPEEGTGEPNSAAFGGQSRAAIDRVYWGVYDIGQVSNVQTIETPVEQSGATSMLSPAQSSAENLNASLPKSEIELHSTGLTQPLPASFVEVGAAAIIDPQSLRLHGYGMSLGEVAAYWKANPSRAVRVYTNADVARLHGS